MPSVAANERRRRGWGPSASRVPPIRAALRNRDLVGVIAACGLSSISEWAVWIGVLVYAHEHGGATAAGTVSIALVLPATLAAPLGGSLADGPRPNRILAVVYVTQALSITVAALCAGRSMSLLTVVVPIAITTTSIAFVHPTLSVVIPGLVTTPAELTAANLLTGYCESGAILLGPLLASAVLAVSGPAAVLWTCAALAVGSSVATLPLLHLDRGRAARQPERTARPSRLAMLKAGVGEIVRRRELRSLVVVLAAQYLLIGGLDLIYIVLAVDELHLSASVPGLLGASFGFGALLGGVAATGFVARSRLAGWTLAALVVTIAALVALAGVPLLATAVCLFPVMGISRSVLDLTGRILLQRSAPQHSLATTFAVLEAMSLLCSALGVLAVQILVVASGARAALFGIGCLLAVVLVATGRQVRRVDDTADAPVVAIRLLRRISLFAALPGPALEGVARAAQPEQHLAGATIVTEGEAGDRYYAIARGEVVVSAAGEQIRTMGAGEGFGEIALLADLPRTATVRALSEVDLLSIERAAFLTVVLGHDASSDAAWSVATGFLPDLGERSG